jgi:hypothetical protein
VLLTGFGLSAKGAASRFAGPCFQFLGTVVLRSSHFSSGFGLFLPPVSPFRQGGERTPECHHGSLSCCSRFHPPGAHRFSAISVFVHQFKLLFFSRGARLLVSRVLCVVAVT